jgi:hypothetical protein
MEANIEYRDLLLKLGREQSRHADTPRPFRESHETIVLGVLSIAIGVATLFWVLAGRTADSTPAQLACLFTAIVGECLGIAGIIIARQRGRLLSPLCVAGIVLCLLHMNAVAAVVLLVLAATAGTMAILYYATRRIRKHKHMDVLKKGIASTLQTGDHEETWSGDDDQRRTRLEEPWL